MLLANSPIDERITLPKLKAEWKNGSVIVSSYSNEPLRVIIQTGMPGFENYFRDLHFFETNFISPDRSVHILIILKEVFAKRSTLASDRKIQLGYTLKSALKKQKT